MAIQSGNFGRLLEPGLRKVFMETYKEKPEQYSKVFNVLSSNKAIETDLRMGGFGLWEKKDSMGSVNYQDPTGTLPLQYIHEEFASGFVVERKLVDDEQYDQIKKMPAALARAARATIETKAAQVLNNAFSSNGYDGVPLVSTSHPRLDKGTAVANQITGALSESNLQSAMILAREQVDDTGILIQMNPKLLVVPPQLEFQAIQIVKSVNIPGTNNNDINPLYDKFQVVVLDYLQALDKTTNAPATSSTTTANTVYPWFIVDPTVAQLNFFWRKKLEFKNSEDFDTMQAKYRGYMRFSAGYSDFRGILGSAGY